VRKAAAKANAIGDASVAAPVVAAKANVTSGGAAPVVAAKAQAKGLKSTAKAAPRVGPQAKPNSKAASRYI
jgi:hypothetical protein